MNRRFRTKRNFTTRIPVQKLVCFQLGNECYAISIERVHRVIDKFKPQGILESDRSLLEYDNEIITLIAPSQLFVSSRDESNRNFLIVCTLKEGVRFGIPVPELPTVLDVAEDKFGAIPELYQQGDLPAAIEKVIHAANGKIIFYLNLEKMGN